MARAVLVERESLFRVLDGWSGHLLEAHRPPPFEHGERGVQRAGRDRGIEALACQRLASRQVPVHVNGLRRPSCPTMEVTLLSFWG